jgi:hypothetical protein
MAIYSIAPAITSVTTTANSSASLITSATNRATLLEIGMTANTAAVSLIGLGHLVAGTTPATTANGIAEDMSSTQTSPTQVALTWSTQPTTPTSFFRKVYLPSAIGSGIIWTFPRGIVVPTSNNVGLWNISVVAAMFNWFVWDE